MKIYIGIEKPANSALSNGLFMIMSEVSICDSPEDADLVIVGDKQKLQEWFSDKKFFAVFSVKEVSGLPENARWIPLLRFIPPMLEYLAYIEQELASREQEEGAPQIELAETGKEFSPLETSAQSQRILVVDDRGENRQLAISLLNQRHFVTLASGYGEGLKLLRENRYDVVLSDCEMLPETKGSALSIEGLDIGQTVHNGIFLIFHATRRGARVAIVTDANHHRDWVSALFDDSDLRKPQEVNGQPVLLINYMGKNWDQALEAVNEL